MHGTVSATGGRETLSRPPDPSRRSRRPLTLLERRCLDIGRLACACKLEPFGWQFLSVPLKLSDNRLRQRRLRLSRHYYLVSAYRRPWRFDASKASNCATLPGVLFSNSCLTITHRIATISSATLPRNISPPDHEVSPRRSGYYWTRSPISLSSRGSGGLDCAQ